MVPGPTNPGGMFNPTPVKKSKLKRPLARNEEFVDYKYVTEDGITKRKKIIKKTIKMVK